jgi:hypothetical protein
MLTRIHPGIDIEPSGSNKRAGIPATLGLDGAQPSSQNQLRVENTNMLAGVNTPPSRR